MGSGTTSHGLPYPLESDSFDPAADMAALAAKIDSSTGYEPAFSTYRPLTQWMGGSQLLSSAALITALSANGAVGGSVISSTAVLYLDPADLAAGTRTVKYRLRAFLAVNQVAAGITLTFGLYPLTLAAGTAGSANLYTLGTVVTGSTATYATPAASSAARTDSTDFTAPSAGLYVLACTTPAGGAANSNVDLRAMLEYRQV